VTLPSVCSYSSLYTYQITASANVYIRHDHGAHAQDAHRSHGTACQPTSPCAHALRAPALRSPARTRSALRRPALRACIRYTHFVVLRSRSARARLAHPARARLAHPARTLGSACARLGSARATATTHARPPCRGHGRHACRSAPCRLARGRHAVGTRSARGQHVGRSARGRHGAREKRSKMKRL